MFRWFRKKEECIKCEQCQKCYEFSKPLKKDLDALNKILREQDTSFGKEISFLRQEMDIVKRNMVNALINLRNEIGEKLLEADK
ncbi:unnamed protein product, partial [marine sediment metagenome]